MNGNEHRGTDASGADVRIVGGAWAWLATAVLAGALAAGCNRKEASSGGGSSPAAGPEEPARAA